MSTKEMITISVNEYNRLVRSDRWLSYLDAAGVDNWSGIETAIDIATDDGFYDEEDEDDA